MTADQKDAIGSLLAIGTVLSDIAILTGTSWASEKSRRWKEASDRWHEVQDQVQCRRRDCDGVADGSGIMCTECWIETSSPDALGLDE
jgi:hypothetical protein